MFCSFFKLITIHDYHLKILKFTSEIEIKPINAQQKALFILYLPFLPELPRLFAQHLDLPTLQQELRAPTLHTGLNFYPGFIFCCFSFRRFPSVIVTFLTLSLIFSYLLETEMTLPQLLSPVSVRSPPRYIGP